MARANRDYLRGLYSTIKFADAHIKFTFLIGVSKFSKVSLFSGLNNLTDITLNRGTRRSAGTRTRTWTRCLRRNLRAWTGRPSASGTTATTGGARTRSTIRSISSLLFFNREFDAYWFETGTPSFLIRTLAERRIASPSLTECSGRTRFCRSSTSTTWRRRRCCFRPAISRLPGRRTLAEVSSTGWAIRTGKCARASTRVCSARCCRTPCVTWSKESGCAGCWRRTTSTGWMLVSGLLLRHSP